MAKNQAAWIKESKGTPFVVEDAPLWPVGAHEIRVKNVAAAVNPVDWKIQASGYFIKDYPNILGTDVAGVVDEVGSGVTGVAKGDRVLAYAPALGLDGKPQYAGFQHYTIIPDHLFTHLPASVSFEQGSVLPLALATASHGLFTPHFLNLHRPGATPDASLGNKTLLVWGAASSVGSAALQLAARAGYHVVATASKHNHEFVRALGAAAVVDYKDADAVAQLQKAVKGEWIGAYDAISEHGSVEKCAEVIGKGKIATTLPPPKGLPEGIHATGVFAGLLATSEKDLGKWLFREYLPKALADGSLKPAPEPLLVKGGLAKVQEGVDIQKKGVSGKKVVVVVGDH